MVKLNLGCGNDYRKGYINVDRLSTEKVDVVHDLDVFPYPFKTGSVDKILMYDILEHLSDCERVVTECYRILKKGGILIIKVGHFSDSGAYYYEHKHFFNIDSRSLFENTTNNMNRPSLFRIEREELLFHCDMDNIKYRLLWCIVECPAKAVCFVSKRLWESTLLSKIWSAVNIRWTLVKL